MRPNVSELLDKINLLLKQKDFPGLSALDYDLLLQHIRSLYDELLILKNAPAQQQHKHTTAPVGESLQPEEIIIDKTPPHVEQLLVLNDVPLTQTQPQVTEAAEVKEAVVQQPAFTPAISVNEVKTAGTINERIKTGSTLNEKLKTPKTEIHQRLSTKPMKDLIDLNRRFVFVKELFGQSGDEFNAAIQHIDMLNDFESVDDYIKNQLTSRFQWNTTSQSARLFVKLAKKKFGME